MDIKLSQISTGLAARYAPVFGNNRKLAGGDYRLLYGSFLLSQAHTGKMRAAERSNAQLPKSQAR